jgi:TIR domain
MAKQIFISYSHRDQDWLDRLLATLAPLIRRPDIDVWVDTLIATGDQWRTRINGEIERSSVVVLMVSTSFLASQFISNIELPQVLEGARQGRLTLVWVPVSASVWEDTDLAKFQAALDPQRPLDQMTHAEAQQALVGVARRIRGAQALAI